MFCLAVVGSTALGGPKSRAIIEEAIERYGATHIVSGGAKGIDQLAAQIGRERGLEVLEFKPEVNRWGDVQDLTTGKVLKGFKTRNLEVATACDALIRIKWHPKEQRESTGRNSYGSGWTRDRAAEQGKRTEEFVLTIAQDQEPQNVECAACGAKSKGLSDPRPLDNDNFCWGCMSWICADHNCYGIEHDHRPEDHEQ